MLRTWFSSLYAGLYSKTWYRGTRGDNFKEANLAGIDRVLTQCSISTSKAGLHICSMSSRAPVASCKAVINSRNHILLIHIPPSTGVIQMGVTSLGVPKQNHDISSCFRFMNSSLVAIPPPPYNAEESTPSPVTPPAT